MPAINVGPFRQNNGINEERFQLHFNLVCTLLLVVGNNGRRECGEAMSRGSERLQIKGVTLHKSTNERMRIVSAFPKFRSAVLTTALSRVTI